jgi:RimJ/RimL family protein N-acetyltransferase
VALVPILTTRLRLRALTEADAASVFAIIGDETTTADVSWRQPSQQAATAWLRRRIADEKAHGVSMWAVELLATDEMIGLCGFFPGDRSELELGYVIDAGHWHNGYATEAVSAAVKAARAAGRSMFATIRPRNAGSLRVAQCAGLAASGEVSDSRGSLLVYRSTTG